VTYHRARVPERGFGLLEASLRRFTRCLCTRRCVLCLGGACRRQNLLALDAPATPRNAEGQRAPLQFPPAAPGAPPPTPLLHPAAPPRVVERVRARPSAASASSEGSAEHGHAPQPRRPQRAAARSAILHPPALGPRGAWAQQGPHRHESARAVPLLLDRRARCVRLCHLARPGLALAVGVRELAVGRGQKLLGPGRLTPCLLHLAVSCLGAVPRFQSLRTQSSFPTINHFACFCQRLRGAQRPQRRRC
jgi:hypothetical protein